MGAAVNDPAQALGSLFDAGHDGYAAWAPLLWDPAGQALVGAAAPQPGERVLDACAGMGSSAVPAAQAVGRTGRVDAVDVADRMLDRTRRRAADLDLPQLRVHCADVTAWQPGDGRGYDLVECAFGVFLLPDMDRGGAHLAGLVRPGGRFAVSTWAHGTMDPLLGPLVQAAVPHRPVPLTTPPSAVAAERVDTAEGLAGWLTGLRLTAVAVRPVTVEVALDDDLAWSFATSSGARMIVDGVAGPGLDRTRQRYLALLAEAGTTALHATALIGTAVRPG